MLRVCRFLEFYIRLTILAAKLVSISFLKGEDGRVLSRGLPEQRYGENLNRQYRPPIPIISIMGTLRPYFSADGARTFDTIGAYDGNPTHGDIRGICIQQASTGDSGTGARVYFATDGGVSKKPAGVHMHTKYPPIDWKTSAALAWRCGTF